MSFVSSRIFLRRLPFAARSYGRLSNEGRRPAALGLPARTTTSPQRQQALVNQGLIPGTIRTKLSGAEKTRMGSITDKADKQRDGSSSPMAAAKHQKPSTTPSKLDFILPDEANVETKGSFVALPLSECPRTPREFFEYQYARVKSTLQNLFYRVTWTMDSKPGLTKRARFQAQRRKIIPTAVAMHRRLNEAMAAGDIATIRELCGQKLGSSLSATILKRNEAARRLGSGHSSSSSSPPPTYQWELVRQEARPRIVSHRIMSIPTDPTFARQAAVVRITSMQRLTRMDPATGEPLDEGSRVQRQRENLLLLRSVHNRTYETGPWYLWGFLPDTTMESWQRDMALLQKMAEQAQ